MIQPLHPTDYDQYIEIKFRDPDLWAKVKAWFNQYQLVRIQELINTVGIDHILTEEAIYAGIQYPRRLRIIHACLEELVSQGWIAMETKQ